MIKATEINNAGVMARIAPTADSTREEWERVIGINLRGGWGRISVFCMGSIRVPRVGLGVPAETHVDCSASHTLIRSHTGEGESVHEEPGGTPGSARRRHALPMKKLRCAPCGFTQKVTIELIKE